MPNLQMPYLSSADNRANNMFRNAVSRTFGYKSRSLDAVLLAVTAYQQQRTADRFRTLDRAVVAWRLEHPIEYANRLGAIRAVFEDELGRERVRWMSSASNNMAWVMQVSSQLDEMKQYVVRDIIDYPADVNPQAADECLARYVDWLPATAGIPPNPDPLRQALPALAPLQGDWNAQRALRYYNSIRYVATRDIRYTPRARTVGNPHALPYVGPLGVRQTRATGCAICTDFGYAAAHVLTHGRPAIPGVPRVEVVSWRGRGWRAHVFVIVGRQVAPVLPGVAPNRVVPQPPTPATWGPDVVIVDAWLGALGNKVVYRLSDRDFPRGFLNRLTVEMERPAG